MALYLMRHGEAEPFKADDPARELTQTGRAAVASKALILPAIDQMIVSPYTRALQTADLLVNEGVRVSSRRVDDRVTPESPIDDVIDDLLPDVDGHWLIVAHNPLLTRLLHRLCGSQVRSIHLDTAAVACLEGDVYQASCASLLWVR